MDDVGFLATTMCGSHSSISIRLLPVPVISGPTSGQTWVSDVYEWYAQVRRWAIGTADNFHFFMVHLPKLPKLAALRFTLGYYAYYGIILCGAPLFMLLASAMPWTRSGWDWDATHNLMLPFPVVSRLSRANLLLTLTLAPYLVYALILLLDRLWVIHILRAVEPISLAHNFIHFVLMGPVLVCLSLVQLWGYLVLAFQGKAACTHHLAGKVGLGKAHQALTEVLLPPLSDTSAVLAD